MNIQINKKIFVSIFSILAICICTIGWNTLHAQTLNEGESKKISELFSDPVVASKVADSLQVNVDYTVSQVELNQITSLNIERSNVASLEGLQNLTKLQTLQADVNTISDLTPLQNLQELHTLNVFQNNISDISVLAKLTNLSEVNISNNNVQDYSPLAGLQNLQILDISSNGNANISSLQNMKSLISFSAKSNGISDITPLAGATNLQTLDLYENSISDITSLKDLTGLTSLNLSNNPIQDISTVANFINLTSLLLDQTGIQSLQSIENMANLQTLTFSNTSISDLTSLQNLTALQHVEFNTTSISDLTPLASLGALTYLSFNSTQVSNIDALAGLVNLVDLHFNLNQISDIHVLSGLTKIETLWMSNNQIQDLTPLTNITNMKDLYFNGNNISNISFLEKMNTSNLSTLNGANNKINDISPLSSIKNDYIGTIFFDEQSVTLTDSTTQGTDIQMDNIAVGLDNTPVRTFDTLDESTITSTNTPLINGVLSDDGLHFIWNNVGAGTYSPMYRTSMKVPFKAIAQLTYSLNVNQEAATLRSMLQVTYDMNGADSGVAPIDSNRYYDEDSALVLDQQTLAKSDATFIGWNTKADGSGTTYLAKDKLVFKDCDVQNSNVTLYAMWKANIPPVTPPDDDVDIIVEHDIPSTGDITNANAYYIGIACSVLAYAAIRYNYRKSKKEVM